MTVLTRANEQDSLWDAGPGVAVQRRMEQLGAFTVAECGEASHASVRVWRTSDGMRSRLVRGLDVFLWFRGTEKVTCSPQ